MPPRDPTDYDHPMWMEIVLYVTLSVIGAVVMLISILKFFYANLTGILWVGIFVWMAFALQMCSIVANRMP